MNYRDFIFSNIKKMKLHLPLLKSIVNNIEFKIWHKGFHKKLKTFIKENVTCWDVTTTIQEWPFLMLEYYFEAYKKGFTPYWSSMDINSSDYNSGWEDLFKAFFWWKVLFPKWERIYNECLAVDPSAFNDKYRKGCYAEKLWKIEDHIESTKRKFAKIIIEKSDWLWN